MKQIKIGSTVRFILANVNFQGEVTLITKKFCYVAVLGYGVLFFVPVDQCAPI